MSAFRIGQRVRFVRAKSKEHKALLSAAGYKVIVGSRTFFETRPEGTVTECLEVAGLQCYRVKFDGHSAHFINLGYQLEPLTDCYQVTTWDAMKETWSPHHEPQKA